MYSVALLLVSCAPLPSFFIEDTPELPGLVITAAPAATWSPLPLPTPAWGPSPSPQPLSPTPARYTVQAGDTLLGIALQHRVSIAAIQLANHLGDSMLVRAGQTLTIPLPLAENESPYWILHIVRPGESLSKIAQTYRVTVEDLLRVNWIADPALIRVDQTLVIPLETLVSIPTPTRAPTLTPTARPVIYLTPTATRLPVTSATAPPQPLPTAPVELTAWAGQVIDLINQKRGEAGLPALRVAPELMRAAQAHAEDCSQRGWGSHVGSDGATTLMRLQRAGYAATAWGENWVQALNPVKAVDWWYDEIPPNDPHRKNILSSRYSEIGVGIAPAPYGYYFIADFGQR